MSEFIAVQGCTVLIKPPATGSLTITSVPSLKVLASGAGVYKQIMNISLSGVTIPGTLINGSGAGVISPTAAKVTAESGLVLRQGDTGTITVNGTTPTTPFPPATGTVDVEIIAAGQVKVKAE